MQATKSDKLPQPALMFPNDAPESETDTHAMSIPGTDCEIRFTRNKQGCLLAIEAAGRTYLRFENGWRTLDDGIAAFAQHISAGGMVRFVRTPHGSWNEKYHWDRNGRAVEVDGVAMHYDESGRIVACCGAAAQWRYEYQGADLVAVVSPNGRRKIDVDAVQRPTALAARGRVNPIGYDTDGRRQDLPSLPDNWHRDALGRLWTITDPTGTVLYTFIWDGFFCLGRIDGAPGEPFAVVYSLDLTGTPVRIISRGGMTRIARESFGETLLAYPLTPGLYGGTVYGGMVHYRARQLDPTLGYFCAPDPFDGSTADPRRTNGYMGTLRVERPAGGAYCVCGHNPVSRADFCGEASEGWTFLMTLGDLTWSLQNNIVSWFGFDGTLNFWASLFGGIGDKEIASRYFFSEWVRSERTGAWGVFRSGAFGLERAFTMQHTIMCRPDDLNSNADIRVFEPSAAFQPHYYGSVLRVAPDGKQAFLLRGSSSLGSTDNNHLPMSWTRCGGAADPAIPGSPLPSYPRGGLHFPDSIDGMQGPLEGSCTECVAGASLTTGTAGEHIRITLRVEDPNLVAGTNVLLFDGAGHFAICAIVQADRLDGRTQLLLDASQGGFSNGAVSLRRLTSRGSEDLSQGSQATQLDVSAATHNYYAKGDPLRLTQGAFELDTSIERLEAELTLDLALPNGLSGPITVYTAAANGAEYHGKLGAGTGVMDCVKADGSPAARIPNVGECLIIRAAAGTDWLACGVKSAGGATDRTVDRDLGALGAADTQIVYRFLDTGTELGSAATIGGGTDLTYEARIVAAAPATGYLKVRDNASPALWSAREVNARVHDVIVLAAALTGNAATPYSVECFHRIDPADTSAWDSAELSTHYSLIVEDPAALDNAVALRLHQMNGATITHALPTAATLNNLTITQKPGGGAWFASHALPWANGIDTLRPHQFVYLTQTGRTEVALTAELRATIHFQRDVTLPESGLELVGLVASGPTYYAELKDQTHITILPFIDYPGHVKERVQMPNFGNNEIIFVTYDSAAGAKTRLFRIVAVSKNGCTVEVDDDDPVTEGGVTNMKVQRRIPEDAQTGWTRIGIEGLAQGTAGADGAITTKIVSFKIYTLEPLGAYNGDQAAIVAGDQVLFAARVDTAVMASVDYEIFFPAQPVFTGANIDLSVPDRGQLSTGFVPVFSKDGNTFAIPHAVDNLTAGPNPMVVVPLVPTDITASGQFTSGTTKVPMDPENWEFDRKRSLVEHELTHTKQYMQWGPLMFCAFPVGILQDVLELTTSVDAPNLSSYVAARIEQRPDGRAIVIPNPGSVEFAQGNTVELSQSGQTRRVDLGKAQESNVFLIEGEIAPIGGGDLFVRKIRSGWNDFGEATINVLQTLTHGGLCNILVGGVWGGLFHLITRGIYALAHLSESSGGRYFDVTFESNGMDLQFVNKADAENLRKVTRVIVKKDDKTMVREVGGFNGPNRIVLTVPVPFTGTGGVSPYSTHDPASAWDWYTYYPASVPDSNRPARITLEPVGGKSLELAPLDRVKVIAGSTTETITVMAVDGANVELRTAPAVTGGDTTLRVAKVSSSDPTGAWDDWFIEYFDMDWMKWLLDPWGRIDYSHRPSGGWQVLTRGLRYAFGTQSWSLLPFGYLWWDNLFHGPDGGHKSCMEQEASEESGDLYSAFAKLRHSVEFVGDIGRYWYFPLRDRRTGHVLNMGRQDIPGVHYHPNFRPRLMVAHTGGGTPVGDPNGDHQSPAGSGTALPDLFVRRNWNTPWDPTASRPNAFIPSDAAIIPFSSQLERCGATYFAFSQPGNHRITVSILVTANDMEVLKRKRQRIWWDLTVSDVDVHCAALPVSENATLVLLQRQRATIRITPNNDRRYALRLPDPEGTYLRLDGDSVVEAQAADTIDDQPLEADRIYRRNADGTYDAKVLNAHQPHTNFFSDIRIPVRRFNLKVIHALHFRTAVPTAADLAKDITALHVAEVRPGAVRYVLVPCAILNTLSHGAVIYPGTAPANGHSNPAPTREIEDTPAELKEYIGDGGIFKLTFDAKDPPQEPAEIPYTAHVGRAGNDAVLTGSITLKPHFRLTHSAGYQVARGSSLTLKCETEAGDPTAKIGDVSITPDGGITPTVAVDRMSVTLAVAADAAVGIRTLLVEDQDHAGHFGVRTIEVI